MVAVLIEKTVIVLISWVQAKPWTAVISLVSKIGIIQVRTVRSSKTLPDNDTKINIPLIVYFSIIKIINL